MEIFAQIIPQEQSNRRLDICKKCEYFRELTKICKLCHCIIPLKVKFDLAECPDKRW